MSLGLVTSWPRASTVCFLYVCMNHVWRLGIYMDLVRRVWRCESSDEVEREGFGKRDFLLRGGFLWRMYVCKVDM